MVHVGRLRIGIFLRAILLLPLTLCRCRVDRGVRNVPVTICSRHSSITNCRRSGVVPVTRVLKSITGIVGRILLILLLVSMILVVPRVRIVTLLVSRAAIGMVSLVVVVGLLLVLVATVVGVTMKRFSMIRLLVVMMICR